MNRTSGYLASVSLALALLCSPLHAKPKFITFQVPGATATFAAAIANSGEVTGYFFDDAGYHGFIRATDATITTIDVPGATNTVPLAIRDDGTIVGNYSVKRDSRGFVRTPDGAITEFKAPHAGRFTSLSSTSKRGWIAGTGKTNGPPLQSFSFLRSPSGHFTEFGGGLEVRCANSTNTTAGSLDDGSRFHGFVRTADGAIAQFDPDGATYTAVTAINNSGTAIGESAIGAIDAGFIRTAGGTLSTFVASEDAVVTAPTGINKAGTIAGAYRNGDGTTHGFVRAPDGTITVIDVAEGSDTELNGINDKGEATGTFRSNGAQVGFIWKP